MTKEDYNEILTGVYERASLKITMTKEEQAEFMINQHGSVEKALIEHQKIMTNISNIYPSLEDCKKNSLSYKHLEDVEIEIKNQRET